VRLAEELRGETEMLVESPRVVTAVTDS
jgi:hypothetical protein